MRIGCYTEKRRLIVIREYRRKKKLEIYFINLYTCHQTSEKAQEKRVWFKKKGAGAAYIIYMCIIQDTND